MYKVSSVLELYDGAIDGEVWERWLDNWQYLARYDDALFSLVRDDVPGDCVIRANSIQFIHFVGL